MEEDIITIDGSTSSGKNSVGFLLAQKLGYQYIDSGSIYRAGCILILRNKVPLGDISRIVDVYKNLDIKVKNDDGTFRFFIKDEDVTELLHSLDITKLVPIVAAIKKVREATKIIQHQLVEVKNTVMTGRDIGSEIFPDAKFKFWLTASVEERAKRRFKQLKEKDPTTEYEEVLKDMLDRDKHDSERQASPMRIPKEAIVIDNTNLTVEQSVEQMLKHIRQ